MKYELFSDCGSELDIASDTQYSDGVEGGGRKKRLTLKY
jgi:hypothetical protein